MEGGTAVGQESQQSSFRMSEKELPSFTDVDILRAHITFRIEDFDCITEERRYIFYNKGDTPIPFLPLPARERKMQRNMKVEDSSHRNLVFIPSSASAALLAETAASILEKCSEHVDGAQKGEFTELVGKIKPKLKEVFKYNPDQATIKGICGKILEITGKETFKKKEFIVEISPLIEILEQYNTGFYYPLVALPEPLPPHEYMLIALSVEKLREYLQDRWERFTTFARFGVLGRFIFSAEPELHPGISNHVRIYAPVGLVIRDVEFEFSIPQQSDNAEGKIPPKEREKIKELEKDLNKKKRECFDEECFYTQLGPEESRTLCSCDTYFNVTFGLSKKRLHLGLLPLLSWFLWLTVLSPLFFAQLRDLNHLLMLLTLSVTILVAIGIYAIDKKIVNHFIITQVVLASLFFAGEIAFYHLFYLT